MAVNPTLLSQRTVYANLKVLSELGEGDKVTVTHNTGEMVKHEPYYGQTLGRWWNGAFNPGIVRQTLTQAFDIMNLEEEADDDDVKTYGHFSVLIPAGFEGLDLLSSTYKAEKKSSVTKELKKITKEFKERVNQLGKMDDKLKPEVELEFMAVSSASGAIDQYDAVEEHQVELEEEPKASEKSEVVKFISVKIDQQALIDPPEKKTAKKVSKWKRLFCCIKAEG